MWQFIGLGLFLALLALLQLLWPLPLPGLGSAPALLLMSGALILYRLPLRRLYAWLLLLAAGFDLLLGEGPLCLIGYALTLSLPLGMASTDEKPGLMRSLGWMLASILIFDLLQALIGSLHGLGTWRMLLHHLPASLAWNLLAALLLLPLVTGLIRLLHYQRFEYLSEVRKGRLG